MATGPGFAVPAIAATTALLAVSRSAMGFNDHRFTAAADREATPVMDFQQHLDANEHWLLRYWWSKRAGTEAAPRRSAIDPIEMVKLLPNLQIHARTAEGRLLCRLSGTAVVDATHVDTTGRHLDEAISPQAYASRMHLFETVLASGRPLLYRARMAFIGQDWRLYRRFMLPLLYRGEAADMILSLVQFAADRTPVSMARQATIDVIDHRAMSRAELLALDEGAPDWTH